jgi:hypothetical protein
MAHLLAQLTGIGVKTEAIRHINATVRNPQAKPIEGWHARLDKMLRNKQIPGYCKRLADGRENEQQSKEIKAMIQEGRLLSIADMAAEMFGVDEQWNNHLFKNRGCDNGKSPLLVYREECAKHPVTTMSDDVLSYIFLPVQSATVRRSQVKIKHPWLQSLVYYHPELSGHGGKEVEVRFDPFDQGQVYVFSGRELLCTAEEWRVINPKSSDQVAEKIEAQRALEKKVRELYAQYAPTGEASRKGAKASQIRRIHPAEREAREVARANTDNEKNVVRATGELRVMRTPFDDPIRKVASACAASVAADRHGNVVDMRSGEVVDDAAPSRPSGAESPPGRSRPMVWKKEERPTGYRLPFVLNMDAKTPEEDV